MAIRRDQIRFWRNADLPDELEVLRASCFNLRYPAHYHDEFVIAAFSRGAQRHRISRFEGIAEAGALMIIPPGEVHTGEAVERADGWDYCAFYPSARFVEDMADDVLGGRGYVDFGCEILRHDPQLTERLMKLSANLATAGDVLEKESMTYEMFGQVISRYGERSAQARRPAEAGADMRHVVAFLNDNFSRRLTVKSIASVAGLSEYHFMRAFRSATGLSVHQYLTQIRITRDKAMLAKDISSAQIALSVGFFDQSHFINRFRSYFGVTPCAYAEACK